MTAAPAKRQALVVLGMHRSGTSALTRALSLLGADLPSRLLEPRPDAVRGYWESADLVAIHDRLLEGVGLSWDGVLPIPESWWLSDDVQGFRREILEVLRQDFGASSLFVIKDPRICRLLPLWTSVLAQFGADPAFILSIRNPLEVIDSLKVRNGFNPARSALLWLRYVVESEIRSRGLRRAIVSYESLLRDWHGVANRLARELEIVWPRLSYAADLAVEGFLDRKLRHEERSYDELRDRRDLVEWVRRVYEALLDAESGDQRALADTIDDVSRQLELADRAFIPVLLELDQQLQGSEEQLAERERVARELAQELAARQHAELEVLKGEIALTREAASRKDSEIIALQDQIGAVERGAVRIERELSQELSTCRDLAGRRELEIHELRDQVLHRDRDLDRLGARLVEKDEALNEQRARIGQLETAFQSLMAERDAGASRACDLEAALAGRDVRIGQVERELRTVLDSTCWKVTGPARRFLSGDGWGARLTRRGTKVLLRFLTFQWRGRMLMRYLDRRVIEVSRTFDPEWYLANNPDVAAAGVRPLVHFLRSGAREGRDPSRLFDTSWYVEQNPDVALAGLNPLVHYVRWGAKEGRDPHPSLRTSSHADQNSDLGGVNPLGPGPTIVADQRGVPIPAPDPKPLPGPFAEPLLSEPPPAPLPWLDPASRTLAARRSRTRPGRRILFVGHQASLTGAPSILLNLVRQASRRTGVECVTLLDEGGPLVPDFAQVSRVYVLGQNRHDRSADRLDSLLAGVFEDLAGLDPFVAVCNSVETADYVPLLKKRGIPTVTLVHEILSLYRPHELDGILDADVIVFPAEFVKKANESQVAPVAHRVRVLPQGLLNPAFGNAAPVPRSTLLREYGVGEESLIVLGCGTADWRKGFDLFCLVAEKVVSRLPGQDVRFCWVGRYEEAFHTAGYWGAWELHRRGLEKTLIQIREVPDPQPYFQAADLFVLTSRADPFPCVVQEAMAARLPVVAFEGAGGAPEAIRADAGVVVPYLDTDAMADEVRRLLLDPDRSRTLGNVGHSRVHEEYSFEDYGEKLLALACNAAGVSSRSLAGLTPRKGPSRGRVVFSASDWSVSGVNTFTHELAAYLLDQGYEAEIVFTQDWADNDRPYLPDVPFTFLECESGTLLDRWKAFEEHMVERAPCVFIPNYDFAISSVSPRLPQAVGIIGIVHSDDVDHYEHTYRLGHYWNRIVAVSQAVGDEVVRLNPAFAGKASVIRYGIDIPESEQGGGDRGRRAPGPLRLIYVGRFVEYQKRVMDYVTLVRHLEARGLDFHLTMVGDGALLENVKEELRDSIRSGRVDLTGRLNQARTRAALREADVLLLLSDFEGLPMALIEAFHMGCVPVVSRIRSGIPEVLIDGVNGYVVEPGDWDGIAQLLEKLQGSPALLQALSAEARATIRRCGLDRSTMGAQYTAVVDEVLAEVCEGRYRRPEALVPVALRGVIPSPYLYVPMMRP